MKVLMELDTIPSTKKCKNVKLPISYKNIKPIIKQFTNFILTLNSSTTSSKYKLPFLYLLLLIYS